MEKPKGYVINGKRVWDRGQTALLEYVTWSIKDVAPVKAIDASLRADFDVHLSAANLSNKLTELVAKGRIEKLGRGLYRHVDNRPHVALFDEPPRSTLFD